MKFQRRFKLLIETNSGNTVVIEPPISIDFTVTRSIMGSLNSMQLRIYNLSKDKRSDIFQDRFNPRNYKKIALSAGYEELSPIFIGNIFQATSSRQGTEIVTEIDARDGGFDSSNTISNKTLAEGTTFEEFFKSLIGDFSNLEIGKINAVNKRFRRPIVVDGNTFQIIKKYSEGNVFIDLETVNIMQENDVIEGVVPLITSSTGLLGTPKRTGAYIEIETIFEPRIIMAQILEIKSDVQPQYDGQYKVIGVSHQGAISEGVGGVATSKFSLLVGSQLFGEFNRL